AGDRRCARACVLHHVSLDDPVVREQGVEDRRVRRSPGAGVRVRVVRGDPRGARPPAREDEVRPCRPGDRAEPGVGGIARCRRTEGCCDRVRAERGDGRRGRCRLRCRDAVQPRQSLRPDLVAAHDHRARRHGEPPRHGRSRDADGRVAGAPRDVHLSDLGEAHVLHPADRDLGRAAPGAVRRRRTGQVVRTISRPGVAVTVVIVTALTAFPFVFQANWVVNIAVFTMMYAGLATAWNLLGGYSGYISLANAAFFGVGAYAIANLFPTSGGPPGYTPFLILPLVGLGVAILSLPIGWIAFRTRGVTFAIVTISLLFVAQTLAFLLHSFTTGSQAMGVGVP